MFLPDLSNLSRPPTSIGQSCTPTSRPIKGDVKRKILPLPLRGNMDVVACIQSHLRPGGVVLVLAASVARPTRLMAPTRGFHDAMVVDAFGSGSFASIR